MGAPVRVAVELVEGLCLGRVVGLLLGVAVDELVGELVRVDVCETVGLSLGHGVEALVGLAVASRVEQAFSQSGEALKRISLPEISSRYGTELIHTNGVLRISMLCGKSSRSTKSSIGLFKVVPE